MELYHYSADVRDALLSKRAAGLATEKEIEEAEKRAKLCYTPGLVYVDHISFFMSPIPSELLPKLFGPPHHTWCNGKVLYEHVVKVEALEDKIKFEVVESEEKTQLYDDFSRINNWVDDNPELLKKWFRVRLKQAIASGEIGEGRAKLIEQIKKNKTDLAIAFLKASMREDFQMNRMKYAANVPHLMLYPKDGEIAVSSINKVIIGKKDRVFVR